MSKRTDREAVDFLDALFREEEPAADVREISDAVAADDELRAYFDRLALADRALTPDRDEDDSPGEFERAFGRSLFDARLDALIEEEEGADVVPLRPAQTSQTSQTRRPWGAWASAAAVVLLGFAAVIASEQRGDLSPHDEFQARTAAPSEVVLAADAPRVSVFCAQRTGGEVIFTGAEDSPFGVVSCPLDAELKLAVENREPRWRYAAFFGVHENGTLLWYGPSPAATQPVEIATSDRPQPVGETIRLGVNHSNGAVRLHALFSERPVDFGQLERWVNGNVPALHESVMVVVPSQGHADSTLFEVVEER